MRSVYLSQPATFWQNFITGMVFDLITANKHLAWRQFEMEGSKDYGGESPAGWSSLRFQVWQLFFSIEQKAMYSRIHDLGPDCSVTVTGIYRKTVI